MKVLMSPIPITTSGLNCDSEIKTAFVIVARFNYCNSRKSLIQTPLIMIFIDIVLCIKWKMFHFVYK